jgi:hypothetical protein
LPTAGQSYYLYYDFGNNSPQVCNIWFGQNGDAGLPNIIIPVNSDSGIVQFTWPAGTSGLWRFKLVGGSEMSGYCNIGIGSEECDYAPWDETL